MAQKFSKPFYNSKEWQDIREYILKRDKYLCQCSECKGQSKHAEEVHHIIWLTPANMNNPMITMHESNLMSVNRDCHFRIHSRKKQDVNEGYEFDENGYVIETNKGYAPHQS